MILHLNQIHHLVVNKSFDQGPQDLYTNMKEMSDMTIDNRLEPYDDYKLATELNPFQTYALI